MNIPAGTPLKTGLALASVDFFSLVKELATKKFNGYIALAIAGGDGFEEGTLFFDDGKPVASVYEYYTFKKIFYGRDAWQRILNASTAEHGVVDVFELSQDQVHLVLAFNEASISVPEAGELEQRKITFSNSFEQQIKTAQVPETRESLLKKYKLSGIDEQEDAGSGVKEVAIQQDFLEKLVKQQKKQD